MLTADRLETSQVNNVTASIGSTVNFICTLNVSCFNRSIRWKRNQPRAEPVYWYNRGRYHSSAKLRGVRVVEEPALGWSVLTIPRVRFADYGGYLCLVISSSKQCRMHFQLSVTGNCRNMKCRQITNNGRMYVGATENIF